jgi:hypothetical protein
MSITTYAELQTAVANWLDHGLFAARIPEFIALFEACANRRLRVRQQETMTNLMPDANGNATLPSDYLSHRRVTWTGSPRVELQYVHPSYLQAAYPSAPADVPRIFTIEGSTLKVRPLDSTALEVNYFQKIPPLATNDPNWLLSAHPDLYLFGRPACSVSTMTARPCGRRAATRSSTRSTSSTTRPAAAIPAPRG